MSTSNQLHLPDLVIQGFRGIDDLTIPRLGRVTLLTGRNSVGKTTALEAVQAYATRARQAVLHEILTTREEVLPSVDEDGDATVEIDWSALFHRGRAGIAGEVVIGPVDPTSQLRLEFGVLNEEQSATLAQVAPNRLARGQIRALNATFQGNETTVAWWTVPADLPASSPPQVVARGRTMPWQSGIFNARDPLPAVACTSLGPGLVSNTDMARLWDAAVTEGVEHHAVETLHLIVGETIKDVVMVGHTDMPFRHLPGRRALVRLTEHDRRVPLRSLGDGALRLFSIALALVNSRGGFLLIDEAENGIHHSRQRAFWRMVLQTAQDNDVQVLATTHSWDCVAGFARAAYGLPDVDGLLVRLERRGDQLRAIEYTEDELQTAAEQSIEVR